MAEHAHIMSGAEPGTSTRRHLMSAFTGAAFAGLAVVAAPADAAEHPDAELLAVLTEFEALEKQIYPGHGPATMEEEEAWEIRVEPLQVRHRACLDRLCEMETHTLEGFRARVRLLLVWDTRLMHNLGVDAAKGFWAERMQLALFRDLAGERAA